MDIPASGGGCSIIPSISALTEGASLIAAQDVVAKAAYPREHTGVATNAGLILQERHVARVVQLVLHVPMAADHGGGVACRCGKIGQIVCQLAGSAQQASLCIAMPDFAIDADDRLDQGLPLGPATAGVAPKTSTVLVSYRLRAVWLEVSLLMGC